MGRLWDIADACRAVLDSTQDVEFEDVFADRDIRDAVVFRLIVIGEAINKISDRLKSANPEVLWRAFVNQRNVLVHGYVEIDYGRVWSTVKNDLPTLLGQVEDIMKSQAGTKF